MRLWRHDSIQLDLAENEILRVFGQIWKEEGQAKQAIQANNERSVGYGISFGPKE